MYCVTCYYVCSPARERSKLTRNLRDLERNENLLFSSLEKLTIYP